MSALGSAMAETTRSLKLPAMARMAAHRQSSSTTASVSHPHHRGTPPDGRRGHSATYFGTHGRRGRHHRAAADVQSECLAIAGLRERLPTLGPRARPRPAVQSGIARLPRHRRLILRARLAVPCWWTGTTSTPAASSRGWTCAGDSTHGSHVWLGLPWGDGSHGASWFGFCEWMSGLGWAN